VSNPPLIDGMWVLDASLAGAVEDERGMYPFCPLEGDPDGEFKLLFGLTLLTDKPPGRFIGVFHEDGSAAAEAWKEAHADYLMRTFGPDE
jgi:hypothetical protein